MPELKPKIKQKKVVISARIPEYLLQNCEEYRNKFETGNISDFTESVIEYVLKKKPNFKQKPSQKKKLLKANIHESLQAESEYYMKKCGITNFSDFIEQAFEYLFDNDRDWKKLKKEQTE